MELNDFVGKELPERDAKKLAEANAFFEIGKYAQEQFLEAVNSNDGAKKMHAITSIVNMTFACELYLKSFFLGTKEGHLLHKLFDDVPENIKELIKFECISNGVATSDAHFYARLKDISNAFVDWRYFYEDDKNGMQLDYQFLDIFAGCLRLIDVLYK